MSGIVQDIVSKALAYANAEKHETCLMNTITVLGAAALVYLTIKVACNVLSCLPSALPSKKYWKKGDWALITGATDGIGLAYAKQFAARGLNVILASRTLSKLEATAENLRAKYPSVVFEVVSVDFSQPVASGIYDPKGPLATTLAGKNVSVLVNNVGESYPGAMTLPELMEYDRDSLRRMIDINMTSCVQVTSLVLPGMVSRKRGCIVNISSAAGVMPVPYKYYALYAGVKAGVDAFSRALNAEHARDGIHVQSVAPFLVKSNLSKVRRASLLIPEPDVYAAAAVPAIGKADRVVPYLPHTLLDKFLRALPTSLLARYFDMENSRLRAAFKRKLAREKKAE